MTLKPQNYIEGDRVVVKDGVYDEVGGVRIAGLHGVVKTVVNKNEKRILLLEIDPDENSPGAAIEKNLYYFVTDDNINYENNEYNNAHISSPKNDLNLNTESTPAAHVDLISLFVPPLKSSQLLPDISRYTRQLGQNIYDWRRSKLQYIDAEYADFRVQDFNGRVYVVSLLNYDSTLLNIDFSCTCPDSLSEGVRIPCQHVFAAMLSMMNYAVSHPEDAVRSKAATWESRLSRVLDGVKPNKTRKPRQLLLFSLQERFGGNWLLVPYLMPVTLFPEAVLADRVKLQEAITKLPYNHEIKQITHYQQQPASPMYSNPELLSLAYQLGMANYYQSNNPMVFALPHLNGALLFRGEEVGRKQFRSPIIEVDAKPRQLILSRRERIDGMQVVTSIKDGDKIVNLTDVNMQLILNDPLWILLDNRLLRVEGDGSLLRGLLNARDIVIPPAEKAKFISRYLPKLLANVEVDSDLVGERIQVIEEPRAQIYLREAGNALIIDMVYAYGDYQANLDTEWPTNALLYQQEGDRMIEIRRDQEIEEALWREVSKFGLKREDNHFILKQRVTPVDFLLRYLPKLQQAGYEVFGEEEMKRTRINRNKPKMSISVSSGIDWFDVLAVVSYGDVKVAFTEVRRAIKQRLGYVKLPDGSLGELPAEWLQRYSQLFALGEDTEGGVRLSRTQAALLELSLSQADSVAVDAEYSKRIELLKQFTHIESHPVPEAFCGVLRKYQVEGYNWLHFLHKYEFGGCLADDMGLGKTIQALVFMQSLYASGHTNAASLIIMPRSLLENWAREAARFTPNLKVLIHADTDRAEDHSDFENYHLVLTTYGVMLRDIKLFSKYRFHYLILDESQAIKNPVSQTARAARLLQGDHRLALTGTPVENSTEELWSLFAFLNPGQLGTQEAFREQFALPIQRNSDKSVAETLRILVHPFIMRRKKEEVAPELPPRTERLIYCVMSPNQQKIYQHTRDHYRNLLLGLVDEGGMQKARFKVLEGLLRLRQLANDPRLVDKSYKGVSSKFEAVLESMQVLREEGHKALVFSQFTSMLALLRQELDKLELPYLYLDGKTQHRQQLVDRFQQEEEIPFFLISLRAGGTGLNLTAADYVLHIDPWWNPAVERQATDRTHRIGQERPVMIFKFIAEDTVEEKILQLQEKKQALVDQLITSDGSLMKSLSRDDISLLFT